MINMSIVGRKDSSQYAGEREGGEKGRMRIHVCKHRCCFIIQEKSQPGDTQDGGQRDNLGGAQCLGAHVAVVTFRAL